MHQVTSIAHLAREHIEGLARNAADNNVPLPVANVFPQGSERSAWFTEAYWARDAALRTVEG